MTVAALEQLDRLAGSKHGYSAGYVSGLTATDEDIEKALATGSSVGTDGSALIGESLDPVVKLQVLDPANFAPMMRRFYAYQAKAITEEWVKQTLLGLADGSFKREGNLGVADASSWVRATNTVRFVGQQGAVTHAMQEAGKAKYGNIKVLEASARLKKLLLDIERDITWGNTGFNSLSWAGLIQQSSDSTEFVSDLATFGIAGSRTTITGGGTLSSATVRAKAETPLEYNGNYNALYVSPADKNSISSSEDTNIRYYTADVKSDIAKGMVVDKLRTDFGDLDVIWSIWLRNERGMLKATPKDPSNAALFHEEVPAQLASGSIAVAAAADGYLPVDEYFYGVAPVNEVGEGPIRLFSTGATTTNTNGKVNVTVTHPASTTRIKSYRLYRSTTNGTDYTKMRFVKEVAIDTAAATQVITDDGSFVPGSRQAIMADERSLAIGALKKPFMRDLPMIDETFRFSISAMMLVNLYLQPHLFRFKNIGGSVTDPA